MYAYTKRAKCWRLAGNPIYPPTINDPTAWVFAKSVGAECASLPATHHALQTGNYCCAVFRMCTFLQRITLQRITLQHITLCHLHLVRLPLLAVCQADAHSAHVVTRAVCCDRERQCEFSINTCSLFGDEMVSDVEPMMAGEDFAFFLQKIPGAMIFLGHYDEKLDNSAMLHNPKFHLHEGVLARGASYHAALATSFLARGGFPASDGKTQEAGAAQGAGRKEEL